MTPTEVAQYMSAFLNNLTTRNNEFCAAMAHDHPTLQQSFTRLCFDWIKYCATEEYGNRTDGRNEASHNICKMIVEQFDDQLRVPYI
jgi:hypothetical protein